MKFIFGREITDPEDFYDRVEELNILTNALRDLQPIAVIGYRRLGKSSLLNVALKLIGEDFITVKVSLEGVRTIRQFIDLYAGSVLTEAVRRSFKLRVRSVMASVRDYLHELLGAVREVGVRVGSLEFYVRLYTDLVDGRVNAIEALREFLDMPQRIAEELGRRVVVVLDEFQQVRFLKQPYPDILRLMRSRWQGHGMVGYAIAGSEVGIMRELLGRNDEPFFAFFRVMELKPFSREVSTSFLRDGLREYGITCPEEILERAYELTGGFPAWLNLVGMNIVERGCEAWNILSEPTVRVVIEAELKGLTQAQITMLKALARGVDVTKAGVNKPNRVLNELINKGLVERRGWGEYEIVDPILRNYLAQQQ